MFATPAVDYRREPDGLVVLRSRIPAGRPAPTILHWLRRFATETPGAALLTTATDAGRTAWSYAEAWQDVQRAAAALVHSGLRKGDRVVVLGPNSVAHLTMSLATMLAGAVAVPVAPQYAGASADRAKLRDLLALLEPALVWAAESAQAAVLAEALPGHTRVLVGRAAVRELRQASHDRGPVPDAIDAAAPAKILLTSGSTGRPKPVAYSQSMMTTNVQMTLDVWPFLTGHRPVLVDWLPWNHAFGGNANVNLVLSQGGTLHIDEAAGRPERLDLTIRNLRRHRPTFHGAVPAGFAALLPALEADPAFREAFFGRLDVMFSAGAAMHPTVFRRLSELSATVRGRPVPIVTGWGSTEVGPGATMVHAHGVAPDCIGTPLPGVEIGLRPVAGKYELLVRGPCVAEGYWRQPGPSRAAFTDDGWYRSGDAGELVDPEHPDRGLRFAGRIADDFKLANGTWVDAGGIRTSLLARGGGRLRDIVVTGADRSAPCVLVWAAEPFGEDDLRLLLDAYNRENTKPSTRILDGALLEPEGDEVGSKGQLVRGAVLARRRSLVERMYDRQKAES
ncbi:AMP-binding protein [Amycolatopsis pithecellobii]|uniref:AMP-binding protein n=1 Tax=Amycolatopsis pithecellobii TaxID=664692 RepID=A0A6N7Z398_9PSEU|nr:AMP-binding protein [Amycolatopsis pithecellobii]MTD55549.1 AMP-binding protein [Amycolatopsis pithecellobii]